MIQQRKGIAVDAWCSKNPGPGGYRGVDLETGKIIFSWNTELTTNNLVEFVAIIHAMKWLKKNKLTQTIWSDSLTAISWVKKVNCKTKFDLEQNLNLKKRIEESIRYLNDNQNNKVMKWDTKNWGEIPADFGRK